MSNIKLFLILGLLFCVSAIDAQCDVSLEEQHQKELGIRNNEVLTGILF
jgi:hypothetical protein